MVSDADNEETVTVSGRETTDGTTYLTLENSVEHGYRVDAGANERYTDEIVRRALTKSKSELEEIGVSVSNVVMPYGRFGKRAQRTVPQVYQAVGNATWDDGVNAYPEMNPYQLSRRYFKPGSMTEAELKDHLDTVSERNALGILAGHTQYEEFSKDRVRTAIRMVKERNIEVVTLRQALVDTGIMKMPTKTTQATTTTETTTTSPHQSTVTTPSTTTRTPDGTDSTSNGGTHSMVNSRDSDILGVGVLTGIVGASAGVLAKYRQKE